jgi:hypothetical protein
MELYNHAKDTCKVLLTGWEYLLNTKSIRITKGKNEILKIVEMNIYVLNELKLFDEIATLKRSYYL